MFNWLVHFPYRWFTMFSVPFVIAAAATSCGSVTQSKNEELAVRLEVPPAEDPAAFWFGVARKELRVGERDPEIVEWKEGECAGLPIREGDVVEFRGSDANGRVLVSGAATAGGEKTLTIPVHRVL